MEYSALDRYPIRMLRSFIESDELVIPSFQRHYVWTKDDVLAFLTSIFKGFPIGVITLVQTSRVEFAAVSLRDFSKVDSSTMPTHQRLQYVLDGSQRLSTLYRCLFSNDPSMAYAFDLENEEFVKKTRSHRSDTYLDLQSLFSAKSFIEFQQFLYKSEERLDFLLDRTRRLYYAFSEYQVPVQILREVELDDAIYIHMMINSSGKRLKKSELEGLRQSIE